MLVPCISCTRTPQHVHSYTSMMLTLKVLVTTIDALRHFLNRIITTQWEGMGEVGSASVTNRHYFPHARP